MFSVLVRRSLLPAILAAPWLIASQSCAAPPQSEPARAIGLQGAPNFRDLGGYPTSGGRHVRWGLVFRSNKLSALTPADETKLDQLHITDEVDLRTVQERANEPDRWLRPPGDIYQSPKTTLAPIVGQLLSNVHDVPSARHNIEGFYARMPDDYRPEFAALFHRLAAGNGPLLIHCTAGKDRTGVAAAILLSALGVPRQSVVGDYSMSETLLPRPVIVPLAPAGSPPAQGFAGVMSHVPPEAQIELWRSEPGFILAAFGSIDREYGSVDGYLKTGLGLTGAQIDAMRSRLTE